MSLPCGSYDENAREETWRVRERRQRRVREGKNAVRNGAPHARLSGSGARLGYRGKVSWFGRSKRAKSQGSKKAEDDALTSRARESHAWVGRSASAEGARDASEAENAKNDGGSHAAEEPTLEIRDPHETHETMHEYTESSVEDTGAHVFTPAAFDDDDDVTDLQGALSRVLVTEASREERIEESLATWRTALASLAGDHDFLTDMRSGAFLDLTNSHPQGLAHLFASRGSTRLSSLVREEASLERAREAAFQIRESALAHAENRGLTTCHLAIGEATWVDLSGEQVHAPLLLRPLNLHVRGGAREDIDIDLDAAVDLNPLVLRALRDEGVLIDARALLELTDSHHGFDPQPVLDAFRSLGEPLPGFRISHALVVGNLVDTSGPMLEDFDVPAEDLADLPIIGALAGDEESRDELAVEPSSEEEVPESVASADADARLIAENLQGRPALVVHGAPGRPLAPTVVAFAAEQIAAGKRVLLVSQSSSRLAELQSEIETAGLEDILLSLVPDPHLQREASRSMLLSLAKASSFVPPVSLAEPEGLAEARDVLTGHVEAMHRVQEPWGVSAHEAINELADLARRRPAPRTGVRLTSNVAVAILKDRERYERLMREAVESGALGMVPEDTPWYGASITSEHQAKRALELVTELDEASLPQLIEHAEALGAPCNLEKARSFAELRHTVRVLDAMRSLFRHVRPELFNEKIDMLLAAVSDKTFREEHGAVMGFGERRRWKKLAKSMLQPSENTENLRAHLLAAQDIHRQWEAIATDAGLTPVVPKSLGEVEALVGSTQKSLDELQVLLAGTEQGTDFDNTELGALHERMKELNARSEVLDVLPRRTKVMRELEFEGFTALLRDIRGPEITSDLAVAELNLAWWVSVLEFIARAEPTLSQYDGTKLSQVAERYRRLDVHNLNAGRFRVRKRVDELLVETMKRFPETSRSAIIELNTPGTMSVRDTAGKYQDIMFRARPLWLASPFMVPQMIPAGRHFDLVILADAARLPTAAAIPAVSRASQAVIVGDPFDFVDGDDVRAHHSGMARLLDEASEVAPVLRLVRDTHPATGGVRRFVENRAKALDAGWGALLAPPSPEHIDEDTFIYVPDGRGPVRQGAEFVESTDAELRRVTDLVIYHARHNPERSLAVLTLTPTHAKAVQDSVMRSVSRLPDLHDFFNPEREEFFTVVPAQAATAIVRDDVIVSLGFGLTPHDRLLHRFGPLSTDAGRRALLTVLTRARFHTSVVSAVRSSDLEVERLRTEGARDLRLLLEFLEAGFSQGVLDHEDAVESEEPSEPAEQNESADASPTETEPSEPVEAGEDTEGDEPADEGEPGTAVEGEATDDNAPEHPAEPDIPDSSEALVADLADRLWRAGYTVELDYGLSSERVELAIAHPELPGRYLVAVATDGPRYREITDQRERDRLSAERLEAAGWTVERVWSWALFIDPEGEAERVIKSVERAYHDYLEQQDIKIGRGAARHRLPKPKIPAGHPLSFYGPDDFDQVVAYICSDGQARFSEQLATEVREFLAFTERSVLLDVSVSAAIRRYLAKQSEGEAR